MFLATTALSQFWDTDQDILFLSTGCLRYEARSTWQSLEYEVMPSPWDDRQRFFDAARYLEECYERMLDRISQYLNTVHKVSYELRYWRIIVGPWLYHYVHAIYDRYTLLADAFSKYPGLQTNTLDPQCFRAPRNMGEFTELICYDAYNLQLFSQLLQGTHGTFPTRVLETDEAVPSIPAVPPSVKLRHMVKSVARFGLSFGEEGLSRCLKRFARVYLCNMNLPRNQTWAIVRRAGFGTVPLAIKPDWSFATPEPALNDDRNNLAQLEVSDEFEAVFVQTLPQNFPSLYLEGFHLAQAETLKKWSRTPPVLVSLTGWYFTEPFKFLAAEGSEKGCRLVAVQHGGLYGTGRLVPNELHELGLSDSFMVWGWAGENGRSHRNLASPKLSSIFAAQRTEPKAKREGPILMVTTAHPRFLLRFQSIPVGGQWNDYFGWRYRFLKATPDEVRQAMLLRPGEKDYGWDIRARTLDAFPEVRWDDGVQFHRSLKNSRIVVSDYPGTTFLEAMMANVPTVLFWDPQRWEMRDEAEPYFEGLRRVGVLWGSPEAAAAHTTSIFADPWEWWGSHQVQKASREFLDRYALGRKDWVKSWAEALREEAALSRDTAGQRVG